MPAIEDDAPPSHATDLSAREIMQAIASARPPTEMQVLAVDLLGLARCEAARSLGTREATIATRLHRGRRHIAGQLGSGALRGDEASD